tara:strand:+ start:1689 stop:5426 length:3738 start_codon:yes stop_codon:yes gene_type:complete
MADNVTVTPAGSKMVFASGSTDLLTLSGNVSGSDASLGYLTLSNNAAASTTGFWIVNNNASSVGGNQYANLAFSSADASMIKFYKGSGSDGTTALDNFTIYSEGDGSMAQFEWRGSGKMTLLSGGNVGINTSTPGEKLHVQGTARITGKTAIGSTTAPTLDGVSISNTIQVAEKSSISGPAGAGWGTFWVSGSTPNVPMFTDDAGTTIQLGAGGGTFGGSLSDNYIPIGTAADTIGNFVLGLTENNGIWIGSDPSSVTDTATGSVALGITALDSVTTGDGNTAIGRGAGTAINTGEYNTFVGHKAGEQATTSNYNNFFGNLAGYSGTRGNQNNAFGYYALSINQGDNNVAMGHNAMQGEAGVSTSDSIGIGAYALRNVSGTASHNVAVGYGALQGPGAGTTASYNTAVGRSAGDGTTTGHSNVYMGYKAGYTNTTYTGNVYIGFEAGYANQMNLNTFIGWNAGRYATGVQKSVFIGSNAAGADAATGDDNTIVGYKAGYDLTSGYSNVIMGYATAENITEGHTNTLLGMRAGDSINTGNSNTAIGYKAGANVTTGTGNVFIGFEAGDNTDHDTESDKLVIANTNTTSPLIGGDFSSGGTLTFITSGNAPYSTVFKHSQVSSGGEDGIAIDAREPRLSLINRRDTDETWKIMANNGNSSLQIAKDSQLVKAIFSPDDGGGVTFGIAAAAATSGIAIAQGASMSFDNTTTNRIYRTGSDMSYLSNELHYFNNPVKVDGNLATASLGQALEFADRDDLLIRGTASYDMEITAPQDVAFGIDSDDNETTHAFLWKKDTKTPSSAGTQLMRLQEDGKLGLGTTPTELFHVYSASTNTMALFESGDNTASIRLKDPNSTQYIHTNASILSLGPQTSVHAGNININSSGYLGIGTTTPEGVLHTANNSGVNIFQRSNDSASYGTNLYIRKSRGTVGSESNTQDGDMIGQIGFSPYYGDYDNYAASISAKVTGTLAADTTPGYLAFSTAAAGANTVSQRMCIDAAGNVGIATTAPAQKLHVEGGFRFRDGNSSSQRLEGYGWNDNFALVVSGTDALGLAGGTPGVRFLDQSANVHLTIQETGTNSALLSGADSAGLYFATQSGTRLELTGNNIIKTGQTIDNAQVYSNGAVNTATSARQVYVVEAVADPGQAGATFTTTLNLPDGNEGGERFTVTCIAVGNFKPPGVVLTGSVVLGGTFINGTNFVSPTITSFTGATAANTSVMQVKTYNFTWVAAQHGVSSVGGWVYTVNTM